MDVREKLSSEKRLIDANKIINDIGLYMAENSYLNDTPLDILKMVIDWIKDSQAVDAVPMVRCRDCKHWKPSGSKAGNSFSDMEYIGGCEFIKYYCRESDFCSYGERKEGADNGC